MEYRRLGKSGLQVSALALGTRFKYGDQMGEGEVRQCMVAARQACVNFFDNAEGYGNFRAEVMVGNVIKGEGWRREDLVISTKIFHGGDGPNDTGLSRKHTIEGVNNSLRRLQLEYVDLIFCHHPAPNTLIEETVRAFDIVIKQGKAFYWGTSEWSAAVIMEADSIARRYGLTPPTMEQSQYNMFARDRFEREYAPLYCDLNYGTTVFSPLTAGLLTGKYNNVIPEDSQFALDEYGWLKDMLITPDRIEKVRQLTRSPTSWAVRWCSSAWRGASRIPMSAA